MKKERKIKFRVEHRACFETYEWEKQPISSFLPFINHLGLLMSFCGVIPPYEVLNELLESGKCDAGLSGLTIWEPIFLSIEEYNVTKENLLNHIEVEYIYDDELAKFSNFIQWQKETLSKYSAIPIDENKIIRYLEQKRTRGLAKCLMDAHQIFMQGRDWHRTSHVSNEKIQKIKLLIVDYIHSGGKYLYESMAALSEFPEFEKEFRKWLLKFGTKDAKLGYYIAMFLNRFDKEKYILPNEFYMRVNQTIKINEIDDLLN